MAQPVSSRAWSDRGAGEPVVRRSWKLGWDARGPMLTGLFGFPWREPVVQAKCTANSGRGYHGGAVQAERWHESVPSRDCSCGIYATDAPDLGWLQRHMLRDSVIINGFVRLSGRMLITGPTYRAEQAEVVGPLTISIPRPHMARRLVRRFGVSQQVHRVIQDGDRWLFRYSPGRRGVSIGEWQWSMNEALLSRYGAGVVGLLGVAPANGR